MSIFAVIAPEHNPRLAAKIAELFPLRYQFAPGQYVVSAPGPTAQTVASQIDSTGQLVGKFVVFSVAGYWGYHDKPLWEWLTLNSG
jgi:hypothetical protein